MAVCFAHFGLVKIWTALILTILAMVNVVQLIISNIPHSVHMRIYSVFKVIQIAICFAHFSIYEISTPVMRQMVTMANIV